jgi:Carboxypeptidase regulatory-like domain
MSKRITPAAQTWIRRVRVLFACVMAFAFAAGLAYGQADQGVITGTVADTTGARIPGASVILTNLDLGQVLRTKSDASGIFIFPSTKIGTYSLTVSAKGFATTTQSNLQLHLQQQLSVPVTLKAGSASQTITVTTETPLMQTQESSVGQVMDTKTINSVALNGRNWVFIAQLAAGAVPPEGTRGQGKGDFNSNGQRAEENNFILDGVDNNANVVDFYNGASFVAQPPPDALAEFKVQTSDYSAEFGHSAGSVVNASIKSGSNNFHGSLWEYLRNTVFDTRDWNLPKTSPIPAYHENQFGASLGGPFLRNKLFFFGDVQANRIVYDENGLYTVPTARMRQGDLSELLDTNLTGNSKPVQLYYQNGTTAPQAIPNNCLATSSSCTAQISLPPLNATAFKFLSYYPKPNTNGNLTYNNYLSLRPASDNTFQWDARMDYTIGPNDTAYSRYSYWNEVGHNTPPLGNILDGGGFGDDGKQKDYGANFMFSETHVFTPTFTNEARFGFNYLHTGFQHPNADNLNFAASVGFGGIPVAPLNGGLPAVGVSGLSGFGSPTWSTTDEHENVYEILDNMTKIWGNHSLKAGVSFQNIRFSTLQPQDSRGYYNYTGVYTSNLNAANTGSGIADFLFDLQNNAGLSNEVTNGDQRSDNAAYFQDDWRVRQNLTLNLGLRWEFFQPYQDVGGYQASYNMTGKATFDPTTGYGRGTANYLIPKETFNYAMSIINSPNYNPNFGQVMAEDGVTAVSVSDPHLLKAQHTNFAPRVGFAWSPTNKLTVRGGYGIFYGGLESTGYWPNLGENYPFQFTGTFPSASCGQYSCPTDGIMIANGFSSIIANGFASNVTNLTMRGSDPNPKTPYTQDYNLSVEMGLTNNMVATLSYVGDNSRHLQVFPDPNNPLAMANPSISSQNARPLPHFGGSSYTSYSGMSDYNSMQAKLEKRLSSGFNFLATYTWAHSLDDAPTPLGSTGDWGYRQNNLIPISMDYSNSPFDTRQRFTFNALYELPFGFGKEYLNHSKALDYLVGGWSTNATWVAQTGNPFTVGPSGVSGPNTGGRRAIKLRPPFATGGVPATNSGATCASSTKNKAHWYNPCSFQNPWDPTDPNGGHYLSTGPSDPNDPQATPTYVTDTATAIGYLGGVRDQVYGPGYERVNMSLFKNIKTIREQTLTFRADIFNLFNTPSLGEPSNTGIGGNAAGQITGPRYFQRYTPDSRFFQLSLHYAF